MKQNHLFLELLQVLTKKKIKLSQTPSDDVWQQLFVIAQKQALTGVCFAAVKRLYQQGQVPPKDVLFKWIAAAETIKQRNSKLNDQCRKLQNKFREKGIRSSILKGQGIAKYYDQKDDLAFLRQPGDIDIYVDCGRKRALQLVESYGFEHVEWDYKHLHFNVFKDTEVEMHYRVEVLLNLWKNRRLQRWFKEHENLLFEEKDGIVSPTLEFNLFYILLHIYRHFLYEGVGMRQLMDYYYVLNSSAGIANSTEIADTFKLFGMLRFAQGVMWIMKEVFGMEEILMVCKPLEKEGHFILDEVMKGGNFGHHDARLGKHGGKWQEVRRIIRHNAHLLAHYPADVIWSPVWVLWHWCWKKCQTIRVKA